MIIFDGIYTEIRGKYQREKSCESKVQILYYVHFKHVHGVEIQEKRDRAFARKTV